VTVEGNRLDSTNTVPSLRRKLIEHKMNTIGATVVLFRDYAFDHHATIYGNVSQGFIDLVTERMGPPTVFAFTQGLDSPTSVQESVMGHLEVLARLKVRPGQLEGFTTQVAEMLRRTREHDTQTLRYDWFINQDQTECEVHEAYLSEEGLIEHNQHVAAVRDALFRDYGFDHRMSVYGRPRVGRYGGQLGDRAGGGPAGAAGHRLRHLEGEPAGQGGLAGDRRTDRGASTRSPVSCPQTARGRQRRCSAAMVVKEARTALEQEVRTMYVIRERQFRLGEDSDITDQAGQPVLHVDGKVLSLRNRLILQDPAGHEAGQVHRKLAALRPTYEITIGGKDVAEVRKHLFTPFGERFTIEVHSGGGMEIDGDLLSHEFTIQRDGQTVATISKRWLTMTASYAVEVAPGEDDLLILASVLALDLAIDAEHDH
jgi:uncharacterized protein YxjI/quinol monooxygenase YgiN